MSFERTWDLYAAWERLSECDVVLATATIAFEDELLDALGLEVPNEIPLGIMHHTDRCEDCREMVAKIASEIRGEERLY